jgi:hypothetical protein
VNIQRENVRKLHKNKNKEVLLFCVFYFIHAKLKINMQLKRNIINKKKKKKI